LHELTCDEPGLNKDITEIIKPIEQRAGVEVRETGPG
jgi:molybdenum cofactor biosynthesis enzyme MoaA